MRLDPQITGGGQQDGLRSGTLNVPGIVGFARAVELAVDELPAEMPRLAALRNRSGSNSRRASPNIALCGPALDAASIDARVASACASPAISTSPSATSTAKPCS